VRILVLAHQGRLRRALPPPRPRLSPRLDPGRSARADLRRRLHAHRRLRRRRGAARRRLRLRRHRDRRGGRGRDREPRTQRQPGDQDHRVAHPLPLRRVRGLIVLVLPWTDDRLAESPFVAVIETAGLPFAASLMAAVIVIALLSSMNANIYGASRMAFSMSRRSMLPRGLRTTNRRGVPVPAVLATSAFVFVAVGLNHFWAAEVLGVLLNIVGSTLIV